MRLPLRHPRTRRAFFVAAVAALLAAAPAGPALAASDGDGSITWSVRPSDEHGPDGRSWVELELDPGASSPGRLAIQNFGDVDTTFSLHAADGYFTETGRFNMLPSNRPSTDAGTWITVQDSVTVPAGGTEVVPYTLTVPEDAEPGDHPAGIAASIRSTGTDAGGNAVGVESRVGFRVMTRVTGTLHASVVAEVHAGYRGSWNPFSPGTAVIEYRVTNTGNARVAVAPAVRLVGPFGLGDRTVEAPAIEEMAPGETRTATVEAKAVWPLGGYSVTVDPVASAVSAELDAGGIDAIAGSASAAAIPWSQAVLLVLAIALAFVTWWDRRRRKAKLSRMLAEAAEQGRAEALASAGGAA